MQSYFECMKNTTTTTTTNNNNNNYNNNSNNNNNTQQNYKCSLCGYRDELIDLKRSGRGCPRSVMVKAMDCGIVVSEFVLQSRYYVHFRENTLWKGMNPLILPAMG